MRTAEVLAALFWLAVALGITAAGWDLRLGTLSDPGSGFMLFFVGAAMSALSTALLIVSVREPVTAGLSSLWAGTRWPRLIYVTVLLALYAALLPTLGFPLVTVLMLLILFKTVEPQSWPVVALGALAATAITWLVFSRWLGTQLPTGSIWGG
jgi:putative tricarboxylic transport membrane protein